MVFLPPDLLLSIHWEIIKMDSAKDYQQFLTTPRLCPTPPTLFCTSLSPSRGYFVKYLSSVLFLVQKNRIAHLAVLHAELFYFWFELLAEQCYRTVAVLEKSGLYMALLSNADTQTSQTRFVYILKVERFPKFSKNHK